MYWFTNPDIGDIIKEKAAAGVKIRILYD